MNERDEIDLGAELHVFRPYPNNVSAGYFTGTLLVGCGIGLALEMTRRWMLGDPTEILLLGAVAAVLLFGLGRRLLADIRSYDQLVLRVYESGMQVETAAEVQRARWEHLTAIAELTPLDTAVSPQVVESSRRPGDAIQIELGEHWRFRLDRNRIADFPALLDTLRDMADAHAVPWRHVHEL